ncbi:MAG: cation transporter, partial [Candidatus Marinimicrobia bacterium]|nr:cation transporter [Candidatus Neomarinimicrobiota bacterium]
MDDFTRLKNKLIIVITVNLFISLSQIIGGIISGSLALISDSVHNLGDTFSIFISLIAIVVARKSSNQR